MRRTDPLRLTGLPLAAAALIAGCSGHGDYTDKFKNTAQVRQAQLKSATEWDMAHQAFLSGELEKALKKVDNSIALNGQVPKSHVLRGRILMEMGSLDQALGSLQMAEALDPENVDAHYYQGIIYERILKLDAALAQYRECVRLDDTDAQYAIAAAEVMIDMNRADEAREFLEGMAASFEHHPGVAQTLGNIAMIQGDNEKAVELFEKARLLAPEDQAVQEQLVTAQIATGRYGEAEFVLAQLLDRKENEARRDLQHLRARCLIELDRLVEARAVYMDLTDGNAGEADTEGWIGLGEVSYALKDYNHVRRTAQRVVALAPSRPEGYMLQALVQMQQGRLDQALQNANHAIRLSDQASDTIQLRAVVLFRMGKYEDARRTLQVAFEKDPGNRSVTKLMAAIDQRIGNSAFANVPETLGDQP